MCALVCRISESEKGRVGGGRLFACLIIVCVDFLSVVVSPNEINSFDLALSHFSGIETRSSPSLLFLAFVMNIPTNSSNWEGRGVLP